MNSQHAQTGLMYVSPHSPLKRHRFHSLQIAMSILANSDNQVREEARKRDFERLYDMMARILEKVQKYSHNMPSEVQPLVESLLLQVSLA